MDVVKENPQWWCLEILDGFGAHLSNLPALRKRYNNRIITLKEEADSSSINQAYDKLVAKMDKQVQRLNLGWLRGTKRNLNALCDQWDLVHCGLAAICWTTAHPECWINSFIAVNLHPKYQLSFQKWCEKLAPFMQAADRFNLVTQSAGNFDTYTLLPTIWQAMTPSEKQVAVAIVQ